jgi:hypothetical protein
MMLHAPRDRLGLELEFPKRGLPDRSIKGRRRWSEAARRAAAAKARACAACGKALEPFADVLA